MNKLVDLTVKDFVNETASDSPAPGGGSAAAFAGAEAAGLALMVIALTENKKAFLALDESVRNEFLAQKEKLLRYKDTLLNLLDEDTEAFMGFMKAMKMPRETEEEKAKRKEAMAEATLASTSVPLETATKITEMMEALPALLEHGNKNCISDLGTAALLGEAGLGAAHFNVMINLPGVKDESFHERANKAIKEQKEKVAKIKKEIIEAVEKELA